MSCDQQKGGFSMIFFHDLLGLPYWSAMSGLAVIA
jgi:hypothetical protein